MAKKPADPVDAAWRDVRRHLDRAPDAPLLVYAFAEDSEPVREMVRRLRVALRARGGTVRHLAPATPEELRAVLGTIFDEHGAVVVIDAPRTDREGTAWADAWTTVIARLNAGREQVRTELKGLVLAMPTALRARAHATGPDLWSVHDVVCELGAGKPAVGPAAPRVDIGRERPPAPPPDVALAAAEAIEAREGRTEGWARTLIDALPGLVERGEATRALQLGRAALGVLPREDARWPELLAGVAYAERATGDIAGAVAHWEEAAGATDALHPSAVWWLAEAGTTLRPVVRDEAIQVLERAADRARVRVAALRDRRSLRDLGAVLDELTRVLAEMGRSTEASAAAEESASIFRQLCEDLPEDLAVRADLCLSLAAHAQILDAIGRPDEAHERYTEVISIARGLERLGTADLRFLPTMLVGAGRLHLQQGRVQEAEANLSEALTLLTGNDGDPRLRSQFLAIGHDLLARASRHRANFDAALHESEQAIAFARSLVRSGPALKAYDLLATCLTTRAITALLVNDGEGARSAQREATELRERLTRLEPELGLARANLVRAYANLAAADAAERPSWIRLARAVLAATGAPDLREQERAELSLWLDLLELTNQT